MCCLTSQILGTALDLAVPHFREHQCGYTGGPDGQIISDTRRRRRQAAISGGSFCSGSLSVGSVSFLTARPQAERVYEPILPRKCAGRGPRGPRTLQPVNPGALTEAYVHARARTHAHFFLIMKLQPQFISQT